MIARAMHDAEVQRWDARYRTAGGAADAWTYAAWQFCVMGLRPGLDRMDYDPLGPRPEADPPGPPPGWRYERCPPARIRGDMLAR